MDLEIQCAHHQHLLVTLSCGCFLITLVCFIFDIKNVLTDWQRHNETVRNGKAHICLSDLIEITGQASYSVGCSPFLPCFLMSSL